MPIGTIHAPGGKVVAVENNYGRIIVGDSYPKLIVRAAITGLVAGLVLLFGRWAAAAVAAWFLFVLRWLFARRPVREVIPSGGSAAARTIAAVVAVTALTVAPPVVRSAMIAPGPGGGSALAIDAGVDGAAAIDAGLDAAPDAGVALDLGRAKVIVASVAYPGACAEVQTAARPPAGLDPAACAGPGGHVLFADLDDVVVTVDYGPQAALTPDAIAAAAPTIHVLAEGREVTPPIDPARLRASGRVVAGHLVYTVRFRAPALHSSAVTVSATLGDQTILADGALRLVAQPFRVELIECARGRARRDRTCELDVGHMHDRVTLFVRQANGGRAPVTISQKLNGDGYRGAAVSPIVDEFLTIAPVPRRGSAWSITAEIGGARQTIEVRLKQAP